jgi:hypothetical protein
MQNEHPFSHEEMRLAELLHEFLDLSDDQDFAGRLILRGPNGEYIGEAKLSAQDIADATTALRARNEARDAMENTAEPLLDVDADDVKDLIREAEAILGNGGLD